MTSKTTTKTTTYHTISNDDDDHNKQHEHDNVTVTNSTTANNNNNDYIHLLLPLSFLGLIDSISFMIVAPSLVFYAIDVMNGTKEQYGIILSTFSFSSFLFKPILGYWCDSTGGLFRIPYFVSISAASLGGLVYFLASIVPPSYSSSSTDIDATATDSDNTIPSMNTMGLLLIFLGRFLGGMGAANSTLGFTYIAEVIPHESMTKASSILSTVRIVGMALAPTFNVILNKVHINIPIGRKLIQINALNSVGLVLFFGNLMALIVMYCTFHEPNHNEKNSTKLSSSTTSSSSNSDDDNNEIVNEKSWKFWKAVLSFDILIPIFIVFALNANFQLLETALAPAASDALNWGPIQVSSVFSFNAILMFGVIIITYQLSAYGISDMTFLLFGELISVIGYTLLYILWKKDTEIWKFILPVVLSIACFPLLGAPSRTVYTELVSSQPYLASHQGIMQALISMAASIAGFVAPGLIASYVLRSPDMVLSSIDQREFTKWALIAPFFSFISLFGVLYLYTHHDIKIAKANKNTLLETIGNEQKTYEWKERDVTCEEGKALLRNVGEVMVPKCDENHHHHHKHRFCAKTEAYRKQTTTLMGIHQISFMEHPSSFKEGNLTASSERMNGRRETVRF